MATVSQRFVTWIKDVLPSKSNPTGTENIYIEDSGTSKKSTLANSVSSTISNLSGIQGIYQYNSNMINNVSTNNYTLLVTDNGKMIAMSNSNSSNVIVSTGLGNTFSCIVLSTGVGSVTISNTANSYLYNSSNSFTLSSRYGMASVVGYGVANSYIVTGDLR